MSLKPIRRMCRHCRTFFFPDYRHRFRQLYCLAADCRLACKTDQQRRWLSKGKNRYYFRGEKAIQRVRDWRKSHPGYWKKRNPILRDIKTIEPQRVNLEHESCNAPTATPGTLQDFWQAREPAFIGLLSMITGSTLQEEIVGTAHNVVIQGRNILGLTLPVPAKPNRVEKYESETNPPA